MHACEELWSLAAPVCSHTLEATCPVLPAAPLQLTALTRLDRLRLKWMIHPGSGYTTLTALSSLRRLALSSCRHLPACLSQLTGLEALSIDDPERCREDSEEELSAVVEAVGLLTSLTHLAFAHYDPPGLEEALPRLPRLRSLWCLPIRPPVEEALPAGGWLTNLQRLGLPIRHLHNSLPALASARQLQTLAINAFAEDHAEPDLLPGVLRWAAQRPALREVFVDISDSDLCRQFPTIMEVQRSVPSLRIERHPMLRSTHWCAPSAD